MKRLKTLRARFALWTAGLLLAALVIFSLFVYASMSRSLTTVVDDTLRSVAAQIIADGGRGELVSIDDVAQDPEYEQLRERGFSMQAWDLQQRLVQAYGPYGGFPTPPADFYAPFQSGKFTTIEDAETHDPVRVYNVQIIESNEVLGVLQVAQNLNNIQSTLNLLLITLLIGGPLVAAAAGAGGYFLAGRALAPINQITETARQISTQSLSARLNLPASEDEVGRLAATFDSMLSRLDNGFRREQQFTADASHELRTPLSAMQTIIDGTLARRRAPDEYAQALEDLSHETKHMRTLTEGLLHLARADATDHNRPVSNGVYGIQSQAESGAAEPFQRPATFEEIDLALLLQDVVDSMRPLADEKGLRIVYGLPPERLLLAGDGDDLIRLFINLLDNAIKYTNQGSIAVTARSSSDQLLMVTIRDTGIGIAPEHLPHIFDRFYRVDGARSKTGSGLGLAIAQSIAETHGGAISVESEQGKFTTFRVRLATNL
ncbi:MAG: ATP-binding protein [Caldilineaceae bacterium]